MVAVLGYYHSSVSHAQHLEHNPDHSDPSQTHMTPSLTSPLFFSSARHLNLLPLNKKKWLKSSLQSVVAVFSVAVGVIISLAIFSDARTAFAGMTTVWSVLLVISTGTLQDDLCGPTVTSPGVTTIPAT
jgi:hypothetical protein